MADVADPDLDVWQVWSWRHQAALLAGCSDDQARMLADLETDAATIRELAQKGCPADLIVKLLV